MTQFAELTTAAHELNVSPRRALASTSGDDFSLYKPAGFVLRWYALTLDLAFIAPLDMLIRVSISRQLEHMTAYGHGGRAVFLSLLATLIPVLLYFVIPTWRTGQTLGKRIVGLRVISTAVAKERRLSFGDALVRETIGKLVSLGAFGAGVLMMRKSPRQRTLHDYLGHSMVITFNLANKPQV